MKECRRQSSTRSGQPASKKKRYVYFDQLQFLLPFVGVGRETATNIMPGVEEGEARCGNVQADEPPNDGETESGPQVNANQTAEREREGPCKKRSITRPAGSRRTNNDNILINATKTFTDILTESISLQMEDKASDKFGNKGFLMSFVPVMDSLPPHLQIEARLKVAELFKELTAANVPSTIVAD